MRKKQKTYRSLAKTFCIVPYVLIFSLSDILLTQPQDVQISERLWFDIFGSITAGEIQSLVPSLESMGAIFLFSLLFGNYISEYWGSARSIFFSRLPDRRRWGWIKIAGLYSRALIYAGLYLTIKLLIAMRSVRAFHLNKQLCTTVVVLLVLLSLVFMLTCLLTNLVSIRSGTAMGVFLVFALVILLETAGILLFEHKGSIIWNPLCFHVKLASSVSLACTKIMVEFFYTLLIAVGMISYIDRMDIW